jgi:GT2 family glycosyltransferase
MRPDAISKTDTLDLLPILRSTAVDADGGKTPDIEVRLGGRYRFRARGVAVEIELISTRTSMRSLVYLKDGVDLYLTIPEDLYRFYGRDLSPPKDHATLGFKRLNGLETALFYARKAARLLFRPGKWRTVLGNMRSRRRSDIVAARLSSFDDEAPAPAERLPLVLGDVDPDLADAGVSIIIPTKEHDRLLKACIESLKMIEDVPFELIIIDNGATRPDMVAYLETLKGRSEMRVERIDMPFNFSALCNAGANLATYPLLLFLNDDIEARDGIWLAEMRMTAAHKDVGAVGARLLYADGTLQHAGIASNLVPGPGHPWRSVGESVWTNHPFLKTAGEVDAVTGACLMIPRNLFKQVGGFDEADFAITLNDVDLCLKVRALGRKIVYVPEATLYHKESQTRRADDHQAEQGRHQNELASYLARYPKEARASVFFPRTLRRDSDDGNAV